jgi:hemerythrin-like domain-containing protein
MEKIIYAFERDDEGHWRAKLVCGHYQHVRHEPPLISREWVLSPEGRSTRVGKGLECRKCAAGETADFDVANLLEADHDFIDEILNGAFEAIEAGDGERLFACADMFWARLGMHIRAEHLYLFPALENASAAPKDTSGKEEVAEVLSRLRDDHNFFMRGMIQVMKALRKNSADADSVAEILKNIAERLAEHNELEESRVYRWADEVLNKKDRAALEERMLREITNLPPRFS